MLTHRLRLAVALVLIASCAHNPTPSGGAPSGVAASNNEASNNAPSASRPRPDALFATYPGTGVTRVPVAVRDQFKLDTAFYAKYANADGIPVIASGLVPDEALLVTRDIMRHMLSLMWTSPFESRWVVAVPRSRT